MDKSKHLESAIRSHQLAKEESLLQKFKDRNKEVKEALQQEYGEKLYSPFNSGSYAKNTAINTKFDFDLVAPFKRNAFGSNGTLKEMFENVYDFLSEKFKGVALVKKQKVSVGIAFYRDVDGHEVNVDVVPGREYNLDQYDDDHNLNLYVNSNYGLFSEGSDRLKTNIIAQKDHVNDRATGEKDKIRKIIRLLKIWKVQHSKGYKSFFLELFVIKAVDNADVSGNLWDKLKAVLEYMRDNVEASRFTLKDPGNSSNNLMDTLTEYDKQLMRDDLNNMLDRIADNDSNIKYYFPENSKFKEEEAQDTYGSKSDSFFSVPPKTNFG